MLFVCFWFSPVYEPIQRKNPRTTQRQTNIIMPWSGSFKLVDSWMLNTFSIKLKLYSVDNYNKNKTQLSWIYCFYVAVDKFHPSMNKRKWGIFFLLWPSLTISDSLNQHYQNGRNKYYSMNVLTIFSKMLKGAPK